MIRGREANPMIRTLIQAVIGGAAAAVLATDVTLLIAGYRVIDPLPRDWQSVVIGVAAIAGLVGAVAGAKFGAVRLSGPAVAVGLGMMVGYVVGGLAVDYRPLAFDWFDGYGRFRGQWSPQNEVAAYHRAVLTGAFGGAALGGLAGLAIVRWYRRVARPAVIQTSSPDPPASA
jgi:hypothetical protein